jgi:polyribonucleotide nucleotidyltransferase
MDTNQNNALNPIQPLEEERLVAQETVEAGGKSDIPSTLTVHETELGGKKLILESGRYAGLADGAITVRLGDTVVLATCVVAPDPSETADYLPLLVDYEEKFYAAGKISGSRFIKREGRPSDDAVLASRLIDRPIRPLFPKNFRHDVQVIVTVLSYDGQNDPDIPAIIAASAAIGQTRAPFTGPLAAVRVGLVNDEFVVNPTRDQLKESSLDLVVAGTAQKVMMIEAGANEVPEEKIFGAIEFGHKMMQPAIEVQQKFRNENKIEIDNTVSEVSSAVADLVGAGIKEAVRIAEKEEREQKIEELLSEAKTTLEGDYKQNEICGAFDTLMQKKVRELILEDGTRPDGRRDDEVRPLSIEVGLLPRTHGSALFTRGQTQALTIATLGAPGEEQHIDTMEREDTKRYMHHYNFPPFSVGEVRPLRGASRREVGHGALAERALLPVLPQNGDFPYTIRLVSEILSSNGSSSMAATCGSTLALMDAGVPIKKPVSGIAMGLVTGEKEEQFRILTDLQGIEDFGGDMDFKVAGTRDGVTAIQLDIKLQGLNFEIIRQTLERAKIGRLFILDKMLSVIAKPRPSLSQFAPRIESVKIDPSKIGELIGPGGKHINSIIDACGGKEILSIDIEEDGTVLVSSADAQAAQKAIDIIAADTKQVAVGETYEGEVVNIQKDRNSGKEIGAIIQILPNKDGMVHISEIASERIAKVSDVLKIGQKVKVKVVTVDAERGRIGLSIKQAQ